MNRNVPFVLAAALLLAPRMGAARIVDLPQDSTSTESLRLDNGLEVRLRNIPGAANVAVALSCRNGFGYDARGSEGLHEMLAELQLIAPAGEMPGRSRAEMDELRPLGWDMRFGPRLTTIVEEDTRAHLPFLLHEVAGRLKGVTVTAQALDSARAYVRGSLALRQSGDADQALHTRVRDLADGTSDDVALRRASGRGLKGVSAREAEALVHALYVPENCSLAIAGDLARFDLRTLITREFGSLPPGKAQPELADDSLRSGTRAALLPGLAKPVGVIGVLAPSLGDTLHPAFYLANIAMGAWITKTVGVVGPPLHTRIECSPLDEPDLVRYYPDVDPKQATPAGLASTFGDLLDQYGDTSVSFAFLRGLSATFDWLFGGPLTTNERKAACGDHEILRLLAGSMSTRALWRGDEFWDDYRRRLETTTVLPSTFIKWATDPGHQAVLVLTPAP